MHNLIAENQIRNTRDAPHTYNLPAEMLTTIFEAGIDPFPSMDERDGRNEGDEWDERSQPFEMLVSHVCQRWRSVAFRAPQLWKGINIYISRHPSISLLDMYLEISQAQLLDICFKPVLVRARNTGKPDAAEKLVLDVFEQHLKRLLPYVHRWRRFHIQQFLPRGSFSVVFSSFQQLCAPSLIEISLNCYEGVQNEASSGEEEINVLQGGAPLLTSLKIHGPDPVPFFRPPRDAVTHLTLGPRQGAPTHDVLLFKPLRNLTHLSLSERRSYPLFFSTPIELHTVRSLDLWILSSLSIHMLRGMHMPAVESLTIRSCVYVALDAFVCHSDHNQQYPVLRSLNFISNSFSYHITSTLPLETLITRFMEMFPTVEELSFCGEVDYTAIFSELRRHNSSNELLWPRLQRITCPPSSSTMLVLALPDIITTIENDIYSPRSLIRNCPLCTDGPQLQRLRSRGLHTWTV